MLKLFNFYSQSICRVVVDFVKEKTQGHEKGRSFKLLQFKLVESDPRYE